MWCGKCQADVAAEVSSDNQRVFCTVCSGLLSTVATPPSPPVSEATGRIKEAHELLKRWSSQPTSDPYAPIMPKPSVALSGMAQATSSVESEVLAVRPGDLVSLAPLAPLTQPKPLRPLPFNSPSHEPLPELSPAAATPIAPAEFVAAPQQPLLSEPLRSPVTSSQLSNVASSSLPDSLFHDLISSPLSAPLLVPAEPLPGQFEWSVLGQDKANSSIVEPLVPHESPFVAEPVSESRPPFESNDVTRRIDAAHPQSRFSDRTLPVPFPSFSNSQPEADAVTVRVQSPTTNRVDSGHVSANRERPSLSVGPFVVSPKANATPPTSESSRGLNWLPKWDAAMWKQGSTTGGNLSVTTGQLLAYGGVLGLTIGGCMVVWSFFGGPVNYAQTGWLVATAGQMLLFFGVITLVSGGLEQTTEQVNRRIEQLGDHIIRIEQAARQHGSVPAAHFDQAAGHNREFSGSSDERAVVEN